MTACRRWEETRSTRRPILDDDFLWYKYCFNVKVINALLATLEAPTVFSFLGQREPFSWWSPGRLKSLFVPKNPTYFSYSQDSPQVVAEGNFDFFLRWVSVAELVGDPPTRKDVKAQKGSVAMISWSNANINTAPTKNGALWLFYGHGWKYHLQTLIWFFSYRNGGYQSLQAALDLVSREHRLNTFASRGDREAWYYQLTLQYHRSITLIKIHPNLKKCFIHLFALPGLAGDWDDDPPGLCDVHRRPVKAKPSCTVETQDDQVSGGCRYP